MKDAFKEMKKGFETNGASVTAFEITKLDDVSMNYYIDSKTYVVKGYDVSIPGDLNLKMVLSDDTQTEMAMDMTITGMHVDMQIDEIKLKDGHKISRGFLLDAIDSLF